MRTVGLVSLGLGQCSSDQFGFDLAQKLVEHDSLGRPSGKFGGVGGHPHLLGQVAKLNFSCFGRFACG